MVGVNGRGQIFGGQVLIFELFYGIDELLPEVNEFSAHFGLQGAKKFILQGC